MSGYYPISLGHNCFPRMYIETIYKQSYPRLPFDYIGTPMWGINHILQDNFKTFASKSVLDIRELYVNNTDLYLLNPTYMFTFIHDHNYKDNDRIRKIPNNTYNTIENDYLRRIERWNTLLKSGTKLLFFRLSRNEEKRILYSEALGKPSEKESLEIFSRLMKEKGIEFRILYFSYDVTQSYDPSTQIIYINIPKSEKITNTLINTLLSSIHTFRHVKNSLN